jgi:probable H4MPT-linked C1 transfer pathway protein
LHGWTVQVKTERMSWLALDIGGANLKAADGLGFADTQSFHLWSRPNLLAEALRALIAGAPKADHLAVTMTGELADCYPTKADGVAGILQAVEGAADHRHTRVYLTDGTFVSLEVARRKPTLAAASNWHALARFASRFVPTGSGVLMDIGSTTCDLIPIVNGAPLSTATSDTERLISGELVYTGVQRSPVCALVSSLPYRGRQCPVAQEVFATSWDAYLVLGDMVEDPLASHTADRRPATKPLAVERLARCICADRESFTADDAMAAATAIAAAQTAKIGIALGQVLNRLPQPPETVILSGGGEFLGRRVFERTKRPAKIIPLSGALGPHISLAAPAHAVAVLAREAGKPR